MTLELKPLGATLGVEVLNFDIRSKHSDQTWGDLRQAVAEHCLVLFRGQVLSALDLVECVSGFGPVMEHFTGFENMAPATNKAYINSSQPGSLRYSGHDWHTDYSYLKKPPYYSCLYFTRTPNQGGDTAFANQYAAYQALSGRWKIMLEGLESVHDSNQRYRNLHQAADLKISQLTANEPGAHPLVVEHPDTGRKTLFVSEALSKSVPEMPRKEGKAILEFLFEHCASPEFSYRHGWRQHDLAVFDNRCTLHRAISDYNLDEVRKNIVVCMGGDWGESGSPWGFQ